MDNLASMKTSVRWLTRDHSVACVAESNGRGKARRSRFGGLWPAFAGLVLVSAPLSAFGEPKPPPGMVLYDHPVFHHGVRVLWHGAWRSGKKADTAELATAKSPQPASKDFSILVDAEDSTAVRLAEEFVGALRDDGATGHVIPGQTSPVALAKAVRSDGADLAIAPMDALLDNAQATADWRDRGPYIARLGSETVEIIAPRATVDVHELTGRDVGYGVADSAGAATAATLFSHLGVAPKPSYGQLGPALADLESGKLAAVVAVGAKTSKILADFGKDGRFHVVPVAWSPALQALYAPVRLTGADRPNLIGANEKVETLGAPMALIALDAAPSSPRAEQLAGLTKSFFGGFDKLLGPDNDAAWRDVNLSAAAPWPRLQAAQAWIDLNATAPSASLEAFRAVAKTSASANGGVGAKDSDRLYDSLMQWRGAGQ